MRAWRPVPPGGTLGVFAPSSPFPTERFEAGREVLERLGFSLLVHPQVEMRRGFLAGDDDARARAFLDLMEDDRVDGVIAARGGYGAHRILERIDFQQAAASRKPVIGFSDVCAVHAGLGKAGLGGIHGPVVTQLADLGPHDHAHLVSLLTSPSPFTMEAEATVVTGTASGPLAGGCLSVLAPMVGTPFWFLPEGAILVLEDVGEAPYRIDRLLTQLLLAGVLDRIAGVAVGDMVGCRPQREGEQTVEEVLSERLRRLGVPVVRGLPFGHGQRNLALPLGAQATLDAGARKLVVTP